MKKKIIILNQKMYLNYYGVINYIKEIKDYIRSDIDVVICPSYVFIPFFRGKYNFLLGAQNLSYDIITGEVNAGELKSLDVKYVILGHSDRKLKLEEDSKRINLNIKSAIDNNIIPIICIGETKEERDRKKYADVCVKQLKDYLNDVDCNSEVVIAYEPIWAIGSGKVPSISEIEEMIKLIKMIMIKNNFINFRVVYGGSVSTSNIDELIKIKDLDGFLIGKMSASYKDTLQIINKL